MATFGFSVGDFVTCLQLIREVAQALSSSRGSAAEYQSLFQTLVSLNQGLAASELIYLQWNTEATSSAHKKNGAAMINGILFERQKCKLLMENFLKASQPYTDAFVKERGKAVVRGWRKVTWLFQKEEVNKLEKELQRHLQALRIYTDALFQNQSAASAEMMGSQVGSILSDVANLRADVSIVVNALQSWGPRKKSLGYPWEASAGLSDNVLLLDATGRSVLLPMLFLSSPAILHDLLNIMYRGIPGRRRILRHEYNITDEDADGILVGESNWNDVIRPGMQLSLNVILQASSSWNIHHCPRCGEAVLGQVLQEKRRRCQKCQLTFRVFDRERVVEESEFACDSSSADSKDSNIDPKASSRFSADSKSRPQPKEKNVIAEDYLFQRVHYQRDIKKVDLIKQNVSVRQDDSRKFELNELPPLHRAAASGLLLEIDSLLDSGEDINAKLPYQAVISNEVSGNFYFEGCTPLQLASYFGKGKAINLLIDRGASLTLQDADGGEALAYAIWGEDSGVAITLLARGADVHAKDDCGRTALHAACTLNIQWLVRLLLQHGADAAAKDKRGNTPSHDAVELGHEAVFNILLETGPDFSVQNAIGRDLLNTACFNGQEKVAKILLDCGADITSRDRHGDTSLHNACWNGSEALIKALLDHGADVTSRGNKGDTPLHNACLNGNEALVKMLLEHGADVTCRGRTGATPLHCACWENHAAVVDILLESGSDMYGQSENALDSVNFACCGGAVDAMKVLFDNGFKFTRDHLIDNPLLHRASYDGFDKIVRLLVERGIKIDDINMFGMSPLQVAAWRGHVETVETLLDLGASHVYQDDEGKTALHSSTIESNGEVTRLLLKYGADHTIRDIDQCDPLLRALWNRNEPVAKILLEHSASLTSRDLLGNTPLIVASGEGLKDVVELLLDAGVDINAASNTRRTALHRACYGGHDLIVKLLIDRGADVGVIDTCGRLPIHDAACFNSADTVRLLLEHGSDPAAKRDDGATVLYCAADSGKFDSVKILLDLDKAEIDAQEEVGGLTALHAAAILGYTTIVELLLEKGADISIRDKEGSTYEEHVKRQTSTRAPDSEET